VKTAAQQQAQPIPGCAPGDEVWLKHPDGPVTAKVLAHGQHGLTVDVGGKQHRVKWDKVHGHKRRTAINMQVEDEGEDGMVVRDQLGRRHFVAVPPEAREERMVVKSHGGGARLLVFAKALKQPENEQGGWTEAGKAPASKGHHVAFQHGEHAGRGEVQAAGRDGVTVKDGAGASHQVPHKAITHRWEGKEAPTAGPGEPASPSDELREFLAGLLKDAPDDVQKWIGQYVQSQSSEEKADRPG